MEAATASIPIFSFNPLPSSRFFVVQWNITISKEAAMPYAILTVILVIADQIVIR